jgi:protoporphyrin/coproporphyrin ferrochelatase
MSPAPTGVCLLYMGGPATLDDVEPFLRALFADRELIQLPGGAFLQKHLGGLIARRRAPRVRGYYAEIGGGSPLGRITARQAALLQDALSGRGSFRVTVAMRYTAPRADDAVRELAQAGVGRCLALPLYPQFSRATSGSSLRDFAGALALHAPQIELLRVESFHDRAGYLDALAGKVREGLDAAGDPPPLVLFSAHSLPQRMIDEGDPYLQQVRATVEGVVSRLQLTDRWRLGFQSRSGPVRWLQPDIVKVVDKAIAAGERRLLLVPVSFVSDHIETLHEIDIRLREQALAAGASYFARSPSLNDDPRFVEALAALVVERCPSNPTS